MDTSRDPSHQKPPKKKSPERPGFKAGLSGGVPIAVGYIPIAITFGLLAKSAGIPSYASILMSFMVFAGASQFVAINLIIMGISPWEIVMTTFIVNLRHFLMSASLCPRIMPGTSRKWMALLSFGVTDETFTVASLSQEDTLAPAYILGLNMAAFSSWVGGTWLGISLASGLPAPLKASMGIALYAMFIGLLVPALRESKPALVAVVLAIVIHSILYWAPVGTYLSTGWRLIITIVTAAFAASLLFPQEVND